jgi:IS1 family transposase/transposase-like protein
MATISVFCPECNGKDVVKHGYLPKGEQRFRCRNETCKKGSFILNYTAKGRLPETASKIVDMAMNASGIRDTARVLGISPTTVINKLKQQEGTLSLVNTAYLESVNPEQTEVTLCKVEEAEGDEMWSFVGNKSQQHWLWHAIDHNSGKILAYVFGSRKDEVFCQLKDLLKPFGIQRFYTDNWTAYSRHSVAKEHIVGKDKTWKIERKHLTLRTRIKRLTRKTICFSKSILMHNIVVGLFINRFEFGSGTANA